jgi:TerB N-terminal domain
VAFLYVDTTFLQGLPFVVQLGIIFSVPWLFVGWHHKRVRKQPKSDQTRMFKTEATPKPGVGQFENGNKRGQDIVANGTRNFDPQQHRKTLETAKSASEFQSIPSKSDRTFGKNINGGWIPKGHSGTVAGRKIGDMVYVGSPPRVSLQGYSQKLKAHIDPTLSVAQIGSDKQGSGMPYWPSYSEISSVCRATYLDWLASGRTDASVFLRS